MEVKPCCDNDDSSVDTQYAEDRYYSGQDAREDLNKEEVLFEVLELHKQIYKDEKDTSLFDNLDKEELILKLVEYRKKLQTTKEEKKEQKAWESMIELYIGHLRQQLPDGMIEQLEKLSLEHTKENFLEQVRDEMNILVGEHENMIAEVLNTHKQYGVYDLEHIVFICYIKLHPVEQVMEMVKKNHK